MIDFSKISSKSVVGKLLRFPFRLIPKNTVVPILQGKLKGKKWIVDSGVHGCWLGCYESEKQKIFIETIKKGSIVYDIGAHVGFYTLLSSELVGTEGKVVAFEPNPRNINYLKEHLRLNRCDNVIIIEAAVAAKSGSVHFQSSPDSHGGGISLEGSLKVRMVSLHELVSSSAIPVPDYMKIDVEGAEFLVLKGAEQLLADFYPAIFLATHGVDVHKQCCEFLKAMGYELQSINEKDIDETNEILASKKPVEISRRLDSARHLGTG